MKITSMAIIWRAIAAGVIGGLLAAIFVTLVAQDSIDEAIAIEERLAADAGEADDEDPLVSRDFQVVGGIIAAVLYGGFTGIAFGTVYAAIRHRIRVADDLRRALLLAFCAFLATAFIPAMKYPANPPAVADPDTVNERTIYYLTLMVGSFVLMFLVARIHRDLRRRFDQPTAFTISAVLSVVIFVIAMVAWPSSPDSIDPTFPAPLLWRFRLQSLTTLAISWATLGLGLGWLLTRIERSAQATVGDTAPGTGLGSPDGFS